MTGQWWPDPTGRHQMRFFDGTRWTEHVADAGVAGVDRAGAPATLTSTGAPPRPRRWGRALAVVAGALASAIVSATVAFAVPRLRSRLPERVFSPISVHVVTDVDRFDWRGIIFFPRYVVPRPASAIPPPPHADTETTRDRYAWAHDLGGIDAQASLVRVIVTGTEDEPAIIDRLNVEVTGRRPPLPGTYLGYGGGMGAPASVRHVVVDLDRDPPTVEFDGEQAGATGVLPVRVSRTEEEIFDVMATTDDCDCRWRIRLTGEWQGRSFDRVVDTGGDDFRTTAAHHDRLVYWEPDTRRWTRAG